MVNIRAYTFVTGSYATQLLLWLPSRHSSTYIKNGNMQAQLVQLRWATRLIRCVMS